MPRLFPVLLAALLFPLPAKAQDLDAAFAERFGRLALECVHREYPNKISHVLADGEDVRPPRELTPAFYGCYDWHSAVHGHWLLARLARSFPASPVAAEARAALAESLAAAKIAGEVEYLDGPGRVSFERPYGLAWLLQLAAELRQWDDPQAEEWAAVLAPLESAAAARLREWIPKLTHPIRIGEHSQTAFAFGLVADWARIAGDREMEAVVRNATFRLYGDDVSCPLAYEPSGHDFLSPCLAEADLLRRFMRSTSFAASLGSLLPTIPHHETGAVWLEPAVVSDPGDPKLAHLDGLNLSRAWMLEGIATGLPVFDPRVPPLLAAARAHREKGLAAVTGEHYEGGHWLGSFAMYLVSDRGGSQVISSGPFEVIYRDVERQLVREVVLPRAHQALDDVTGFLGLEYDDVIIIDLSDRHRVPNQYANVVNVPADRLAPQSEAGDYGISVVHEVTHVVAVSAYRESQGRFYDDGLAVYLQWRFGQASSYPDFGRDLHAETAALARELGNALPLAETEATRRSTRDGDLSRLAYLQEGSFTRFLIENVGLEGANSETDERLGVEKYLRVYFGESLEEVYGRDLAALEAEWRAFLEAGDG